MEVDIVYALAMVGTAVFALSGAMAAARKGLDIFGFIVVGTIPAIGGGTVRDLLLDTGSVFWVKDLNYIYVATICAVIAFFQVHRLDGRRYLLLVWADAFGLALFTIMGTQVALAHDMPPIIAVMMGMITGTFGGVIRDIVCNEVPLLLQKEIYALPAIFGSCVYLLLITGGVSVEIAMMVSVCATLSVRGPAIFYGWSLPPYKPKKKDET